MLVLSTFVFQAKFYLNFKFATQQLKNILVQFLRLLFAICFNGITVFSKGLLILTTIDFSSWGTTLFLITHEVDFSH